MVAVDSNFLPLLLSHQTTAPEDPATKQPIEYLQERIELLIETLENDKETIIIPTPVLSEFLVLAERDGPKYLSLIDRNPLYRIAEFDIRAAIELAAMRLKKAATLSKKAIKRQTPAETWAKLSFDRQIVAIAKVNGAHTIYSDDGGVKAFATEHKIKVVHTWELPRPQGMQMTFEELESERQRLKSGTPERSTSTSGSLNRESAAESLIRKIDLDEED